MSNDGADFYDKEQVKNSIPIPQENTKYDDTLDTFGEDSNRLVTDLLTIYSIDPTSLSDAQNESGENIANYNTICLWFTRQHDFDSAKAWDAKKKEATKALIATLEIDPIQNPTVVISSTYRTSPLDSGV